MLTMALFNMTKPALAQETKPLQDSIQDGRTLLRDTLEGSGTIPVAVVTPDQWQEFKSSSEVKSSIKILNTFIPYIICRIMRNQGNG